MPIDISFFLMGGNDVKPVDISVAVLTPYIHKHNSIQECFLKNKKPCKFHLILDNTSAF